MVWHFAWDYSSISVERNLTLAPPSKPKMNRRNRERLFAPYRDRTYCKTRKATLKMKDECSTLWWRRFHYWR
jgi:hypothetical protein